MKRTCFLISLLCFFSCQLFAQPAFEVIGDTNSIGPDTVQVGNSLTFTQMGVRNVGNQPYVGQVLMMMRRQGDSVSYVLDTLGNPSDTMVVQDTLMSNFSSQVQIGSQYTGGINVIIVWPEAPAGNVPAIDSVKKTIYVDPGNSRDNPSGRRFDISVFPNPTQAEVFLKFGANEAARPRRIALRDVSGREVYVSESEFRSVSLANLPAGTYFLELDLDQGRFVRRLVKY